MCIVLFLMVWGSLLPLNSYFVQVSTYFGTHLIKRRRCGLTVQASILTLSYQHRRLSCPHMQILVEQSSLQTQYCWPWIKRENTCMNNTGHFTLPSAEREISWCPLNAPEEMVYNLPASVLCSCRCSWGR